MTYVLVNRMGGLGNQLFQYAAARAVAYHHPGVMIYVEEETENIHNHRGYDYASLFMRDARVVPTGMSCPREFHPVSGFAPWHPEEVHPPIRLNGYFQYLPAIMPVLPDLVVEFQEALQPFLPMRFILDPEKSLFVHVRRGDYLKTPQYHYTQTIGYYEEAFRQWRLRFKGDDFQVFIVSDDPSWCRCQPWSFPYTLYENEDEIHTLAFMSQCRAGAILANSTFSYWGAMLSQSAHVFYPERWIAETVYNLFPSHWCCVRG